MIVSPLIFLLLGKLVPLYCTIGLGYLAGKKLGVSREAIAPIVFYLLVPFVIFGGVMRAPFTPATFSLPIITFAIASGMGLMFYRLGKGLWRDSTPGILGFTAGNGNTGYFGLPLAIALFSEQTVGAYILCLLGVTLYETSVGYYLAAKGRHPPRDALLKIARLPTLYAFFIGLTARLLNIDAPVIYWDFLPQIRGAYIILGMMIIGLGLAGMTRLKFDWLFVGLTHLARFAVWPAAMLTFLAIDSQLLHWYGFDIHRALILISIVPLAANTVVVATLLDAHPEKAAAAVVLSTLFALLYVPFMAALFIG